MSDAEAINVRYTNWRGETAVRRVLLGGIRFGTTEWHKEPTWLISAFDLDHPAQIWKEFDLTKCDFHSSSMDAQDALHEFLREGGKSMADVEKELGLEEFAD